MNKTNIRRAVFQIVFSADFCTDNLEPSAQEEFIAENYKDANQVDISIIKRRVKNIYNKLDVLDKTITKSLDNWKFSRLSCVDRAILRVAVYEIMFDDSLNQGIAINEAVNLAKKFGNDKSGQFINGVLSGVIKDE